MYDDRANGGRARQGLWGIEQGRIVEGYSVRGGGVGWAGRGQEWIVEGQVGRLGVDMGQSVRPVLVVTEAELGFRDVTSVVGARAGGARVCDTDTSESLLNAVRALCHEGM
jgi:hypothetical protein